MSSLRVLFYNHTGKCSGAERVLLDTLAALQAAPPVDGHQPYILSAACPTDDDLASLIEAQGVTVHPVPTLKARFTSNPRVLFGYLRSFARNILGFRKLVRTVAPDLLYANTVRAGLVATLATLGTKTPVAWHVHDDLPVHPLSTLIRRTAFHSRRTTLLAVSKATAIAFAGSLDFGHRLRVLYNGVDLARFPHKSTVAASTFRDELGLASEDQLVAAVGMINPRKGLAGLLDAFRLVADSNPKAHLAIVGAPIFNRDDLHLADLQRQCTRLGLDSRVHFTGPRKDIPAVLRAADLLVLNALVEPFGLVLVEGIASGTPVLTTRVGGIPEIVTDERTGFLVEPGNSQALATRLLTVLSDPTTRARVAATALAEVAPRFSRERYAEGILTFFRTQPKSTVILSEVEGPAVPSTNKLRAAVFHDNFAQNGGAERVAEVLHRTLAAAYPGTHLHSTLSAEERLSPYLQTANIRTTWMQWLPARAKLFRAYFLLYPLAVASADLYGYDLILSSCFGYAKGIRHRYGALHICYCHTPMRWVWRTEDYLSRERNSRVKTAALALPLRWLKAWELRAATRPDLYIANSQVVAKRLHRAFGVRAEVIPPPIDTARFAPPPGQPVPAPDDFYLVLSRLVPYKRFDLAVEACTRSNRRLVVIGDGPDRARLESMAGPTITFLGRAPDGVVTDHARRCRALLFPGEEDFGMTPLEVNAAGRPVVAFKAGGATETVIPGLNGVFFAQPTVESLLDGIAHLESQTWDPDAIRAHAEQYDISVFSTRILDFVRHALALRSLTQPAKASQRPEWITE